MRGQPAIYQLATSNFANVVLYFHCRRKSEQKQTNVLQLQSPLVTFVTLANGINSPRLIRQYAYLLRDVRRGKVVVPVRAGKAGGKVGSLISRFNV